jgi:hypothetical protein
MMLRPVGTLHEAANNGMDRSAQSSFVLFPECHVRGPVIRSFGRDKRWSHRFIKSFQEWDRNPDPNDPQKWIRIKQE